MTFRHDSWLSLLLCPVFSAFDYWCIVKHASVATVWHCIDFTILNKYRDDTKPQNFDAQCLAMVNQFENDIIDFASKTRWNEQLCMYLSVLANNNKINNSNPNNARSYERGRIENELDNTLKKKNQWRMNKK